MEQMMIDLDKTHNIHAIIGNANRGKTTLLHKVRNMMFVADHSSIIERMDRIVSCGTSHLKPEEHKEIRDTVRRVLSIDDKSSIGTNPSVKAIERIITIMVVKESGWVFIDDMDLFLDQPTQDRLMDVLNTLNPATNLVYTARTSMVKNLQPSQIHIIGDDRVARRFDKHPDIDRMQKVLKIEDCVHSYMGQSF